jgi:hypothetical protein
MIASTLLFHFLWKRRSIRTPPPETRTHQKIHHCAPPIHLHQGPIKDNPPEDSSFVPSSLYSEQSIRKIHHCAPFHTSWSTLLLFWAVSISFMTIFILFLTPLPKQPAIDLNEPERIFNSVFVDKPTIDTTSFREPWKSFWSTVIRGIIYTTEKESCLSNSSIHHESNQPRSNQLYLISWLKTWRKPYCPA